MEPHFFMILFVSVKMKCIYRKKRLIKMPMQNIGKNNGIYSY